TPIIWWRLKNVFPVTMEERYHSPSAGTTPGKVGGEVQALWVSRLSSARGPIVKAGPSTAGPRRHYRGTLGSWPSHTHASPHRDKSAYRRKSAGGSVSGRAEGWGGGRTARKSWGGGRAATPRRTSTGRCSR